MPVDALAIAGRRVLVAGLGVSGRAAATVLHELDAIVTTLDEAAVDADLRDPSEVDVAAYDLVLASPGWRPSSPVLIEARAATVPVWSEVELAWRVRADRGEGSAGGSRHAGVLGHVSGPAPWLAITGTNGKTTTVGMVAAIGAAAGLDLPAVGNVGDAVVLAAREPQHDALAVELSSFQLHHTSSMAAHAAVVLNVAADHLDWHGTFEDYVAAKATVYRRAVVACVYPTGDGLVEGLVRDADVTDGALAVGVTLGAPGPGQLGLVEGVLVDRAFHSAPDAADRHATAAELGTLEDLAHLAGPGGRLAPHMVVDALAAAALARSLGIPARAVRDGLRAYRSGAHRVELVATVADVAYVDDSKATNAHAAAASLASLPAGTVVWIAGGLAKGASFDELVATRADRLRAVVVIGVDQEPLRAALARHAPSIPVHRVDPADTGTVMTRAVEQARGLALPGDTVLLAPACASMDQFDSYAQRGAAFARAVVGAPRQA